MKYKKIILILLIPFFLSGCADVDYELEIQNDLTVSETVFMSATSDYFAVFYREYPKTVVKRIYDNKEYMQVFPDNGYTYEMVSEDNHYPGILVKKNYNTLADYATTTIFKGQSFENITTVTNENLVTIKATGFLPYEEDVTDGKYMVSNATIKIKVPYIVTDNNADKYDLKTNTYTWLIDRKTTEKEINLTFDKNKIYVYNVVMYISIFILCLLGVILLLVARKIIKKNKMNNRIVE